MLPAFAWNAFCIVLSNYDRSHFSELDGKTFAIKSKPFSDFRYFLLFIQQNAEYPESLNKCLGWFSTIIDSRQDISSVLLSNTQLKYHVFTGSALEGRHEKDECLFAISFSYSMLKSNK